MTTLTVGKLKANFSNVLESVKKGEEIIISYGKKKENIAVIIPYKKYQKDKSIKLGALKDKMSYKIAPDFKMTTEELLSL